MPSGTLIDGSSFQWTPLGARYEGEDRGVSSVFDHYPSWILSIYLGKYTLS